MMNTSKDLVINQDVIGAKNDLVIEQGKTFSRVVRWEASTISYKPITGITKTAPASITSTAHGLVTGWRAAVVSVTGMTQINSGNIPPKGADYHTLVVANANTVTMQDVNASGYTTYLSGGYLQINDPVDLTSYTPRMQIRSRVGGTLLASTEAADAPLNTLTVTSSNVTKTITITISAANTAAFAWSKGVYEIEMVASGVVKQLMQGAVTLSKEITT